MLSQCPTADRLVALLEDDLAPGERTLLDAHLAECMACREKLNELAGNDATGLKVAPAQDDRELEALLARLKPEESGERIGPYKLLQQIGEGGFGTVWMAEQNAPVKRRVALKIIKIGMDTREVVARFEQERQALAMMDHPNIAKVFDAGATEWGRPFFVMELVRGVPITDYCDEQKLPVSARLTLFIQVCQALQHAHQKGIIHRDLKPSNILISTGDDHEPVPKIIDFGVAKAMDRTLTDRTLFTQFEQMIGTPTYMSPEQAGVGPMDIDTRSDIYSLGVLLYELLTGKPPFDPNELGKAGHDEMRRVIREEEPPRPSTRLSALKNIDLTAVAARRHVEAAKLASIVRGDLDWIVMKTLEKNRNRRYETANGLAMDLRRHLDNEPVLARPPSFGYKAEKFIRKHKGPVGAAAAMLVVLIFGLTVSTILYLREKAAWRSEAAQRAAADRHAQAEATARKEAEAISTFLRDYFRNAFRRRHTDTADAFADAVRVLDIDLANQPAGRAKLQETLAAIYYATERYRDAIPLQEKVNHYYVHTFGPEHRDSLEAMSALAHIYAAEGRRNDAAQLWDTVIKARSAGLLRSRNAHGEEAAETLASMNDMARSYDAAGRHDDAVKMWESVLALSRKLNGPEHRETFATMHDLAASHEAAGRKDKAEKIWEELLVLRRKVLGSEHPETLRSLTDLALFYSFSDRRDRALKLREEILTVRRNVLGPEHPITVYEMIRTATAYLYADRKEDALKLNEEALPLSRKVNGPDHADTLLAIRNLATSYSNAGRKDEAIALMQELLALRRKLKGPEHRETLRDMLSLAGSYNAAGRKDEALKIEEELLAFYRKTNDLENRDALAVMSRLANSYLAGGRRDEALNIREEALAIRRKMDGLTHSLTRIARDSLIKSYRDAGLWDKALPLMAESSSASPTDTFLAQNVSTLQAWFGKNADHATTCRRVMALAAGTDDPSVADRAAKGYCVLPSSDPALLETALTLARRAVDLGKDHQYLAYYQMSLGIAEYRHGDYGAADAALLAAEQAKNAHRHVREAVPFFRAMSLFRQGKAPEARQLFTEAQAQMKPLPADERQPLANNAVADDIIIWLAYKEAKALLAEK